MAIVAWKEIYETGIVALDNEHRVLVEQINLLSEAIRDKRSEEALQDVLGVLEDYTETHFKHEETLMREYGFPGLEKHQDIHQNLRDQVAALRESRSGDTDRLVRELHKLLRNWLLEHIVKVDKSYGAYLESRGGRFIS